MLQSVLPSNTGELIRHHVGNQFNCAGLPKRYTVSLDVCWRCLFPVLLSILITKSLRSRFGTIRTVITLIRGANKQDGKQDTRKNLRHLGFSRFSQFKSGQEVMQPRPCQFAICEQFQRKVECHKVSNKYQTFAGFQRRRLLVRYLPQMTLYSSKITVFKTSTGNQIDSCEQFFFLPATCSLVSFTRGYFCSSLCIMPKLTNAQHIQKIIFSCNMLSCQVV